MDNTIIYSPELNRVFSNIAQSVKVNHYEYATPEHLLLMLLREDNFERVLHKCGASIGMMERDLEEYLSTLDKVYPDDRIYQEDNDDFDEEISLPVSHQLDELLQMATEAVINSGRTHMLITHVVKALLRLEESNANYILRSSLDCDEVTFMTTLVDMYDPAAMLLDDLADAGGEAMTGQPESWKNFVTCINDLTDTRNPLIGREAELDLTVRVLSRKDKNNVLHIGQPGVGKTALVYGLARLINEGTVPDSLKESKIYQLDLGTLLAGTQFRGDFERRLKIIMDGVEKEPSPIVYIDEIHNLVGAGATGDGAMDASNMLKPYLEEGRIRFIGSTTYDEYKRFFAKSKGLVRRFRQIDIVEPSIEETKEILDRLKPAYEEFHGVSYTDEAIDFAVRGSAVHITDRYLPDKAIDLLDEAGAGRKIHPADDGSRVVDEKLVAEVLAKICKVESLAVHETDEERLLTLQERISSQVYGQDEAIRLVTEAIQMSKAGLNDDNKPLASLLFVGPTGVGKTEVAKVLAAELGVELLRFDMSEYTEKHAVAKLIGSPAGYVGYEDGGQLTDAIRRSPNAVLLLDEIEKAHSDIYDILLQVMDYARLTDNKGNKADFRNVVVLMTSNAGAQFAQRAKVGFGSSVTAGSAMMREVKRMFKPEFLNRLSGTVVFNEMDSPMAALILEKKLRKLHQQLEARNVTMTLSDDARNWLLAKGFTREYGAREMDRVIASNLKPLLMREILFGRLKAGGEVEVILNCDQIALK